MGTNETDVAGEREKPVRQDGEPKPPDSPKPERPAQPQSDGAPTGKGIPPLPEPDVEGVGEESGPSSGARTDTLRPDQRKMAEDGTGF